MHKETRKEKHIEKQYHKSQFKNQPHKKPIKKMQGNLQEKKTKDETRKRNAWKKKGIHDEVVTLLVFAHITFDKKGRKWKCVLP